MKKYLLLFTLATLMFGTSNAEQLTPQQALERLNTHGSRVESSKMQLAYTASESNINQFYVFNTGINDGFMIVAADDCISPLIGYADSGSFDYGNLPDNMQAWLKEYQRQIDAAIKSGSTISRATTQRAAIAPMVKTQWNQNAPYNNDCPMDGSSRSVTGCVATAMAQVMKYHNWPPKGKGSNSYQWENSAGETKTLTMDFSSITFDWANMSNTYSSSSTAAQNAAVAKLMAACGHSVDMDYSSRESGAPSPLIAPALINYFDYDGNIQYLMRDYYGIQEWEEMIYAELAARRPVIYDGSTASGAGHEFVCDGYENGYFHINWGWGGISDGYFKLTLLTPETQGIGGSNSGYNFHQGAVFGIQKNTGNPAPSKSHYVTSQEFTVLDNMFTETGSKKFQKTEAITFGSGFFNMSPNTVFMNFGLKLTNVSTGKTSYKKCAYSDTELLEIPFSPGSGFKSYPVYATQFPTSDTYTITPAFYDLTTATWHDILVPISNPVLTATCTTKNVTISRTSAVHLSATNVELLTPIYEKSSYKISAKLSVTESEYHGIITAKLYKPGTNNAVASDTLGIVDILSDEPLDFESIGDFFNLKLTTPTTYDLVLADNSGRNISDRTKVTVYPLAATSLTITNIKFPTATLAGNIPQMPCNQISVSATVTCTAGYLSSPVMMYIFPRTSGEVSSLTALSSEHLFLAAGSSQEITVTGAYSTPGNYFLAFFFDKNICSDQVAFNLTEAVAGITDVTEAEISVSPNPATDIVTVNSPDAISLIEIYSLSGMHMASVNPCHTEASIDVANYPAGHYVVRITTARETVTKRLIKR
ncbi:MAG: thiol protease/hemagglutinin PrtT [Bacteroides sp.]|nr:thiol protease/hemagglutinin PrtT [Bacteroides sp.]MCM1389417.1 thiol protease/hemagglutinin PrtT [Bacteroides sp.]